MLASDLMKPSDDQAVKHQRHRRGAPNGFLDAVGGILQTQELFAVFERDFDFPAIMPSKW